MRETEGLYRAVQVLKRTVMGVVALAAGVLVVGYFFLMRQVDTTAAWAAAARELQASILRYGETPEQIARVYQRRPSNYYRPANGLLAATPQRLIYVGVEPRDQLAGPDAPAAIITSEFVNDTLLELRTRRVYLLTAHGVVASRAGRSQEFAASSGTGAELDRLVAFVRRDHARQRAAAAAEQRLRRAVAALVREPIRYVVSRGDALSTIAARFGTVPESIRAWNRLPSNRVRLRDTLVVKPGGVAPPPFRPAPDSAAAARPGVTPGARSRPAGRAASRALRRRPR